MLAAETIATIIFTKDVSLISCLNLCRIIKARDIYFIYCKARTHFKKNDRFSLHLVKLSQVDAYSYYHY